MFLLEHIHIANDINHSDPRFPVQYVVRPMSDDFHDYRGYAGRVASGVFHKGEKVTVLPSGFCSKIKAIDTFNGEIDLAFAPQSVTITLEDDIDISRGDMLVKEGNMPEVSQDIDIMVCWLNEKPMQIGGKYTVKHTSREVRCVIKEIKYKMNINTLEKIEGETSFGLNEIGLVTIRTTQPLFFDSYRNNRVTGSLVLIDEGTNNTVGAGMIE